MAWNGMQNLSSRAGDLAQWPKHLPYKYKVMSYEFNPWYQKQQQQQQTQNLSS